MKKVPVVDIQEPLRKLCDALGVPYTEVVRIDIRHDIVVWRALDEEHERVIRVVT